MTENRSECYLLRELLELVNNNDEKLYDLHFGNLIKYQLQREGRSVNWFALQMNSDRSNMYKILTRPHLNSEFILRASLILDHDFFKDISEWMKSAKSENQQVLIDKKSPKRV